MVARSVKRFLAGLLAAVVAFTSFDVSALAYVGKKENGTFTASAEELIVEHYQLDDATAAVVKSNAIIGLSEDYDVEVALPVAELASVDSEETKVYAKSIGNWKPVKAEIVQGENVLNTVNLTAGEYGEYDYSADFDVDSGVNNYSVKVTYELTVSIDAGEQTRVLQIPVRIAQAYGNMEKLDDAAFDAINTVDNFNMIQDLIEDEVETEIDTQYDAALDLYGKAEKVYQDAKDYYEAIGEPMPEDIKLPTMPKKPSFEALKAALNNANTAMNALDALNPDDFSIQYVLDKDEDIQSKGTEVAEKVAAVRSELTKLQGELTTFKETLAEYELELSIGDALDEMDSLFDEAVGGLTGEGGSLTALNNCT